MSEICEEDVTRLNQLIHEGDPEAVQLYITEKNIKPGDSFYKLFASPSKLLKPVCLAVKCGNVAVTKTLLHMGFPVNEQFSHYSNIFPIHLACEQGNVEIVKLLVEDYGVDITHGDNCSRPVLCEAARNGNIEVLRYFLEKGISVDFAKGMYRMSALHAAAESDQAEVCKFLLSKGATVDICNSQCQTPLMFAARHWCLTSANVLLEAGADVNACNDHEETAFIKTAQIGDIEMMELLVSHGADPERVDSCNRSPLHIVVANDGYQQTLYLLNKLNVTLMPPKYYEQLGKGETVCRLALRKRNYGIVRFLINAGYDPSLELEEYKHKDNKTGSSEDLLRWKGQHRTFRGDQMQLQELKDMIAKPRSLFNLCILRVRRVLGRRLPFDIERLPLPDILKQDIVSCGRRKLEMCILKPIRGWKLPIV